MREPTRTTPHALPPSKRLEGSNDRIRTELLIYSGIEQGELPCH
jgi:hypothetical protein